MERNITVDYFKILLSILVVLIHMHPLFGEWNYLSLLGWEISNGLSRIAVPCFFILNGYFFTKKMNEWDQVKKYIKRIFIIYIVWLIIYLSFFASFGWITLSYSSENLLLKIFLGYSHLWYLATLIQAALILFLINKLNVIKKTSVQIFLILALLILGYIIQSKFVQIFDIGYYYYRNAIFFGLPFLLMGVILKKKYNQLKNIKKFLLFILFSVGLVGLFIESYISYTLDVRMDIYISLIIVCPVLCLLVLNYSRIEVNYDGFWGKLSSCIYYTHLIGVSCVLLFPAKISMFLKLPLAILITLMISFVVIDMNKKIKIFF